MIDGTKQALCGSNKWLLEPPQKPTGIARILNMVLSPFTGPSTPRLEYIVTPWIFLGSLWAIVMAATSFLVYKVATRSAPNGRRDAILLVIVNTAIVYHMTWAVYRWQECLLKPVLPHLARFA